MAVISLTPEEREQLTGIIRDHNDDRLTKRAWALIMLADGDTIEDVSEFLGASTRTLYNWIHRFTTDPSQPILDRLTDKQRSGRPRKSPTKAAQKQNTDAQRMLRYLIKHNNARVSYSAKEQMLLVTFPDAEGGPYAEIRMTHISPDEVKEFLPDPTTE